LAEEHVNLRPLRTRPLAKARSYGTRMALVSTGSWKRLNSVLTPRKGGRADIFDAVRALRREQRRDRRRRRHQLLLAAVGSVILDLVHLVEDEHRRLAMVMQRLGIARAKED